MVANNLDDFITSPEQGSNASFEWFKDLNICWLVQITASINAGEC